MFIIKNEYNNANIARTIRFTEKIYRELKYTAKSSGISFNTLVLQCCRYSLNHLNERNSTKFKEDS